MTPPPLDDELANRARGLVYFLGPIMGGLSIACEEMERRGMSLKDARLLFEFAFLAEGGHDDQEYGESDARI
jgi:hypothetical protein